MIHHIYQCQFHPNPPISRRAGETRGDCSGLRSRGRNTRLDRFFKNTYLSFFIKVQQRHRCICSFFIQYFFFFRRSQLLLAPRPVFFVVIILKNKFFVAPTLVYFWSRCLASSRKAGIAFFCWYVCNICM